MGAQEKTLDKKQKRGRPATGQDRNVGVRFPDALIARIDDWAEINGCKNRSEAIRRLVELSLSKPQPDTKTPGSN